MTLAAGARLGPYEILAPIGAGGMGEVYRARDHRLDRNVAIKVLPTRIAQDPAALARFEREAKAVAALSHPNILSIFDFGAEGGVAYTVTELLEGETLRERLSGDPVPARAAVDWASQIARGLAAAHEQGIVHRDIKPENVFLTKDGRVKILDFGLAKDSDTVLRPAQTSVPTVASLTEPGTVLGTVSYMSPEQVRGAPLDHRSDIFSFGAVLYEMLAGRRAFDRATAAETMTAILKEEPPALADSAAAASSRLEPILRHCLEKGPESRFQSARDLAFALDSGAGLSSGAASIPAGRGPTDRGLGGAERTAWIVLAVLLAAAGAVLWARGPGGAAGPTARTVRFTIPPPPGSRLEGMLALSPDGSRLAFVASTADGRSALWIRPLDALEARRMDGTEGALSPFWSPDGRSLAFFAQGKLKKFDPPGSSVLTLCDAPIPRGGSWGTGGTILFSAFAGGEIHRVAETGGNSAPLAHLTASKTEWYRWPNFLPDGRHFLFFRFGNRDTQGVYVGSLDSTDAKKLAQADAGASFMPPGRLLFRLGDRLMGVPFDLRALRVTGDPVPVVDGVWWDGLTTLATAFSVSASGALVYQMGGLSSSRLLWLDRSGRQIGAAGAPGAYLEPALSPDGRALAVTRADSSSGRVAIWTMDLPHGTLSPLSSGQGSAATPLWSRDGKRVAFSGYPSGGVFLADAHGAGQRLLFQTPTFVPLTEWSPDGRFFLYDQIDWKKFRSTIGVQDLQGGQPRSVLPAGAEGGSGRLSPNGLWLAYCSWESGEGEIYVRGFPSPGDRRQVSTGGGSQPVWRADGKELFYVSLDGKIMSVPVQTEGAFDLGQPRALFQTRILPLIEARNHYDVTADGRRFIVNSRLPDETSLPITVVLEGTP